MRASRGPDLAIVGAARSATSYLSGTVGRHDGVDPGAIKEPSYYSSRWERGPDWYDSLYETEAPGLLRMDASVSYTFPQHPEALDRLHAAAPGSTVVYVVRDPLLRAISHYHLLHYYFRRDESTTFADAARHNPLYLGASDYATWLGALAERWPDERIVIVPFSLVREDVLEAARVVLAQVGLGPVGEDSVAVEFRNSLRSFRSKPFRLASKALRHSHLYPRVRRLVGADGMRRINRMVTTEAANPSPAQELEGFAAETCDRANALATRSWDAVAERLAKQDSRLGLDWAGRWAATPAARAHPHASLSPGENR